MRRPTSLLMLALSGLMFGACSGGHSTSTSGGAEHSASATAGGPVSTQRALAFARAVNLRATDVPGFTASLAREAKTPSELRAEREMLRCTGSSGSPDDIVSESSKEFKLKRSLLNLSVSSEVGVAHTTALAAGELGTIRGAHVRGCVSRYLDDILQGERVHGVTVGSVTIQAGTPPAPGTAGGFGWRITAPLMVRGIRVPFYMDILGFVDGRARVTLFSSGALLPFPAAIQQQLFTLLLERVKANRL